MTSRTSRAARQIQPFARFIQHEQVRIIEQRLSEGQALNHPLAETSDRLPPGRPTHALQQFAGRGGTAGSSKRAGRTIFQQALGRQIRRKSGILMHEADPCQGLPIGQRTLKTGHIACRGLAQRQQNFDQRGFAGAIGSEQGEDFAGIDAESNVFHGQPAFPAQKAGRIELACSLEFSNRFGRPPLTPPVRESR